MHRLRDLLVQARRLETDHLLIAARVNNGFWSMYARVYDAIWDSPISDRLAAAVCSVLEPTARTLDMGCGTGLVARLLTSRGTAVIAVDPSNAMIDRCRGRSAADLYLVAAEPPEGLVWESAALINVLHVCDDAWALLSSTVSRTPGRVAVIWPHDAVSLFDLARWERSGGLGWLRVLRCAVLRLAIGVPGGILGARRRGGEDIRVILDMVAGSAARTVEVTEVEGTGCSLAVIEARS